MSQDGNHNPHESPGADALSEEMEKLFAEHGARLFERTPIAVEPWEGSVPTDETDVAFLPVHRLAALLRAGQVSSVELTEIYLDRLKRYDPLLLFAVTILEDRAREEAQQADSDLRNGYDRGPLHGIPYGVKDLFSVTGAPTTWGSEDFTSQVIDEDAELVVRLREAGAVLLAKLSTGRFAAGACCWIGCWSRRSRRQSSNDIPPLMT